MGQALSQADLFAHDALGITPEMLTLAGVRRVDDQEAAELLSSRRTRLAGVVYPYMHPVTRQARTHRVRRDSPDIEKGEAKNKYVSTYGDRSCLYFPPDCGPLLPDVSVPVIIVKAEKSVLSVTCASERMNRSTLAVGTGGCWGWRGRINPPGNARGPVLDLDLVTWTDRDVVIAFDANAATNTQVQVARRRLAEELEGRGASVRVAEVQAETGVNGPDDLIGLRSDEVFFALVDHAKAGAADAALILNPLDPHPSALAFLSRHHIVDSTATLRRQQGVFYVWEQDVNGYLEREDATVRADLWGFLDEAQSWTTGRQPALIRFRPTRSKVADVLDALCAVTNLPESCVAPCWLHEDQGLDASTTVAFPNGLLDVATREFRGPTPNFYTHNALTFPYDAAAPEPQEWFRFLSSLWPDDEQSIEALQQIIGYLLVGETRFQKIFMLVGPKRSGKSTIGRVIRELLGRRNVCAPTLASLGGTFGRQVLIHKSAAIISDARITGRTDTAVVAEELLSISGEDARTIPRKFLSDWTGPLSVRFLLLTNELPRISDASGALASRFVVLALKHSFYGREDQGLFDRLAPELPGILRWALDGWDRLEAGGHFLVPKAAADLGRQFEDLGSPVGAFLNDRCEIGPKSRVERSAAFEAWKTWCQDNGRDHPGTLANFGRDLRAAVPGVEARRMQDGGVRRWYWHGLRLATVQIWIDFRKRRVVTSGRGFSISIARSQKWIHRYIELEIRNTWPLLTTWTRALLSTSSNG